MAKTTDIIKDDKNIDALFDKIANLIEQARVHVSKVANTAEVYTKYSIGQYIVEYEQQGERRAAYGKAVLKKLSEKLTYRFGEGWSVENLTLMRRFYNVYSDSFTAENRKRNALNSASQVDKANIVIGDYDFHAEYRNHWLPNSFILSWTHYLVLMRIEKPDERNFYEIECTKQQWSVRQLKRQYGSSLYERLALSRDKDEVMRLAKEGQVVEKPQDIIKSPVTLEFLGLKRDAAYSESAIEGAIISKLRDFLLEMGKGFLFEARQKRFVFDERNFYVDLVLYNRLLQCYVLIDLKSDDLTHQDLGQMQMYVNYFDRYIKRDFEKPTVGILLCREKSDALVELTLPKNANIYATEYALYLPQKSLLHAKLKEWIEAYEEYEDNEKQ